MQTSKESRSQLVFVVGFAIACVIVTILAG